MYCAQCGSPLLPGARFCQSCGASAEAPQAGGYAPAGLAYADTRVEYAGFWIRFLALFIDGIIIGIVAGFISVLLGRGAGAGSGGPLLIRTVISAVYVVVALSRWGQTVGALAVGIKVVDVNGGLLSPGAAFIRWIGSIVSGIILGIGYLMMIWDPRKQTLHDKMAGSYVVKASLAVS